MFWGSNDKSEANDAGELLRGEVRTLMPEADDDTVRIVAACAGLLAAIAYADRDYSDVEERRVTDILATVQGLGESGASTVLALLRAHSLEFSTVQMPRFTRTLKELGDRELRLHVLEACLEVAAADDDISDEEVKVLRQLTTSLGLEQSDYNELQLQHRDKLAALKPR
jgi:uncharacterized tellurite resistance protein B-like protein